jgi:hypothetical protein
MVRKKRGSVDEEGRDLASALLEKFRDPMDFPGTGPPVHLGHLLPQFVPVPLHKAADDIELAQLSFSLPFRHFEYGADRFFNGRLEEPASVDDRDVRLPQPPHDRIVLLSEPTQDVLAVHQVLGAPEADDAHFLFGFQV